MKAGHLLHGKEASECEERILIVVICDALAAFWKFQSKAWLLLGIREGSTWLVG